VLIFFDDGYFDSHRAGDDVVDGCGVEGKNLFKILFNKIEQAFVLDDAVFDDFGETVSNLIFGESVKKERVDEYSFRWRESAK